MPVLADAKRGVYEEEEEDVDMAGCFGGDSDDYGEEIKMSAMASKSAPEKKSSLTSE